jgi:4-amino-4-deoxy-L-arabinose transferase-like glycosyltransferase
VTRPAPPRRDRLALAAAALAYAGALLLKVRTVPDGLVIDQAEEALRGLILVSERRLEVLTFVLGNSAETLWLYVLGASATALGPTVLALALPSALAAAATVWLVVRLVGELDPETPWWIPFLLAAGSPWLIHYGRSGLRAITAPLFVAATAFLLARLAAAPGRTALGAAAGLAAGLAVYGYTASRLIPVALAAALGAATLGAREERAAWRRASLAAAAAFAAVSIPNAVFFAGHPREFLFRGAYSAVGSLGGRVDNLVATALLPLHYPDRYRFAFGEAHAIDGVSASLTGSGIDPVPLLAGLLAAGGLVLAVRRRREPAVLFLLALHVLAVLGLGSLGPSLTRLLLLAPVLVVWAALGAGALAKTPRTRLAAAAALTLLAAGVWRTYFVRLADPARQARNEIAEVPAAMGERARALALAGRGRVVAIVAERPNVARYFAWGTDVVALDFWARPFDAREVAAALPARMLLVEKTPLYAPYSPPGFVETPSPDARWREWTAER